MTYVRSVSCLECEYFLPSFFLKEYSSFFRSKSVVVKLGTVGEYGTPSLDIPESFFDIEFNGRRANIMYPRQSGSFWHASKVHDTYNIMLACRIWGLRSTDIMQGVVYGTRTQEINPLRIRIFVRDSISMKYSELQLTVIARKL